MQPTMITAPLLPLVLVCSHCKAPNPALCVRMDGMALSHLCGACVAAQYPAWYRYRKPRIYYRSRLVYSTRFAVQNLPKS
jgi:hypothetical protein